MTTRDPKEKMTGVAAVLDLGEMFGDLLPMFFGVRNPKTGKPITFSIYPGQHTFNYYIVKGKRDLYCYTPHKDDEGNYWAWTYVSLKNGDRQMTGLVRCAKRKTARGKALDRYYKAVAHARALKEAQAARKAARKLAAQG